jgi:hypothetical protein
MSENYQLVGKGELEWRIINWISFVPIASDG